MRGPGARRGGCLRRRGGAAARGAPPPVRPPAVRRGRLRGCDEQLRAVRGLARRGAPGSSRCRCSPPPPLPTAVRVLGEVPGESTPPCPPVRGRCCRCIRGCCPRPPCSLSLARGPLPSRCRPTAPPALAPPSAPPADLLRFKGCCVPPQHARALRPAFPPPAPARSRPRAPPGGEARRVLPGPRSLPGALLPPPPNFSLCSRVAYPPPGPSR